VRSFLGGGGVDAALKLRQARRTVYPRNNWIIIIEISLVLKKLYPQLDGALDRLVLTPSFVDARAVVNESREGFADLTPFHRTLAKVVVASPTLGAKRGSSNTQMISNNVRGKRDVLLKHANARQFGTAWLRRTH